MRVMLLIILTHVIRHRNSGSRIFKKPETSQAPTSGRQGVSFKL